MVAIVVGADVGAECVEEAVFGTVGIRGRARAEWYFGVHEHVFSLLSIATWRESDHMKKREAERNSKRQTYCTCAYQTLKGTTVRENNAKILTQKSIPNML